MKKFGYLIIVLLFGSDSIRADESLAETLVGRIKNVGREGAGNVDAGQAWRELVQLGTSAWPTIFKGMNETDLTAANWLYAAIDKVAEQEIAAGRSLPAEQLEAYVANLKNNGRARRLAYDLLVKADESAQERLLPGMLNDPSIELRRDAVARVVKMGEAALEKKKQSQAKDHFQKAFAAARDPDQVDMLTKRLKELGEEVDIAAHFGFVRRWMVVGPFDNTGGVGHDKAYMPETKVDLAASYTGKADEKVTWKLHTSEDEYGIVDLNKVIRRLKGATAYAYAEVESTEERPIDVRAASANAVKIFLNGKLIFAREEYHHGMTLDQHSGRGRLQPGRNTILVKVCQNEQMEQWTENWSFQLRLCDSVGTGINLPIKTPVAGK